MASQLQAPSSADAPPAFGTWLRLQREAKEEKQRRLAAAADMDSSHLGKVERGERFPTPEQAVAMARHLGLDEVEMQQRLYAAKLLRECGGNPQLAHGAAAFVQEHAAPMLVSKSANNRAKKK